MRMHLVNGKIYQGAGQFVQALAIEDGVIVAAGSVEDLGTVAEEVVDLQGRCVLPGLNDSHMHLVDTGFAKTSCDLSGARSISDVITLGRKYLEDNSDTVLLRGRGWNHDNLVEKRLINRHDLDQISKTVPILFVRACGNISAANSAVIDTLGIASDTVIPGGDFQRDETGRCNGVFFGDATTWLQARLLEDSEDEIADAMIRVAEYAASRGLTSVQSNDVLNENADTMFSVLHKVGKHLPVRCSVQFGQQDLRELKRYFSEEFLNEDVYDERVLRRGSLKLFKDGALGVRTAEIEGGYADDPQNTGFERLTEEEHYELTKLAHDHGVPVVTHAIGDKAIRAVLNNYVREIGRASCRERV